MREIKFRLWDDRNKRFGYLQIQANLLSWPNNIWMSQNNIGEAVRFDDVTAWQQYTGLKDKSGKEIYEGDIVKIHDSNWMMDDEFETMQVKWGDDYPAFDVFHLDGKYHDNEYNWLGCSESSFEVIGNIYENPDPSTPAQSEHQ